MKGTKFKLRGFLRPRELAIPAFGKLEHEVMNEIWRRGELSVRQLHAAFGERMAYTTLMTTLDRLYKKGILARRKDGRAFIYSTHLTREELEVGVAEDVIEGLLTRATSGAEPVLACIVDALSERDRGLLDELDRLIQEKKRELQREG
jgi:predicted transcriptional regulator